MKICQVHDLGLMKYEEAWKLQRQIAGQIASGERDDTLLLAEHPHTYTFGRRGEQKNLLWNETDLLRRGIEVHWVDRGGDVTYHGPGQLVGYPLLALKPLIADKENEGEGRIPQADFVGYIRRLEKTLVTALAAWRISAGLMPGLTGVWAQPEGSPEERSTPAKIAAIGIKVDARGITQHGFALNVAPDMSFWQGIVPCGLDGYPIACLADFLDPVPDMKQVKACLIEAFGSVFTYEMTPVEQQSFI